MPCRATQDRWVMVESSDKTWSTGEGMASHLSILALRAYEQYEKAKRLESVIIITLSITQLQARNQEEGTEED